MSSKVQTLDARPSFYDPANVGKIYEPSYQAIAEEARRFRADYGIKPAGGDKVKLATAGIDWQLTFGHPDFELFVAGSPEDAVRRTEFGYKYLPILTRDYYTMDTHFLAIFGQDYWVDANGEHPVPGTQITVEDVESGRWRVNPAIAWTLAGGNYMGLQKDALYYVRKLKEKHRYDLQIWPYHAQIMGIGHALLPIIHEAAFFRQIARMSMTHAEIKGGNPIRENYSVFGYEVLDGPDGPVGQKNVRFIKMLMDNDAVIFDGEAGSHCFPWTLVDLVDWAKVEDPKLIKKIYALEDCTSPVVIPPMPGLPNGLDFTSGMNNYFDQLKNDGVIFVKSTDPIESWPGMDEILSRA